MGDRRNQKIMVRLMLPMRLQCNRCESYIAEGKEFKSLKQTLADETYLGVKVFRFCFNCNTCSSEITLKTDPKNSGYIIESGARRCFEALEKKSESIGENKVDMAMIGKIRSKVQERQGKYEEEMTFKLIRIYRWDTFREEVAENNPDESLRSIQANFVQISSNQGNRSGIHRAHGDGEDVKDNANEASRVGGVKIRREVFEEVGENNPNNGGARIVKRVRIIRKSS